MSEPNLLSSLNLLEEHASSHSLFHFMRKPWRKFRSGGRGFVGEADEAVAATAIHFQAQDVEFLS